MAKLVFYLLCLIKIVAGQNRCSEFLQYNEDFAIITLKVPSISDHNLKIKIKYDEVPSEFLYQKRNSDLTLGISSEKAVSNIRDNKPLEYHVKLSFPYPRAKIVGIYHNDRTVCEESLGSLPSFKNQALKTITHGLDTGIKLYGSYPKPFDYNPHQNDPIPPRSSVYIFNRGSTDKKTTTPIPRVRTVRQNENFMCGERNSKPQTGSLIFGGSKAAKHDFPWLVAHFYRLSGFMCGGSLVSHRIVVTAGHCIHEKGSERISEYDSTYYLGKHKLSTISDQGTVVSGVEQFITHKDWNPQEGRYVADIGIAVLTKHIRFTDWIRPICIWDRVQSHSELAGDIGTVAGWGVTRAGNLFEEPMSIEVPIVDDEECIASHDVLSEIKDATNFCIGDGAERTPCQGDSGGGFIVRRGPRFYLRGIVSAAVLVGEKCSEKDYAVMTDVAQYSSWINNFIDVNG